MSMITTPPFQVSSIPTDSRYVNHKKNKRIPQPESSGRPMKRHASISAKKSYSTEEHFSDTSVVLQAPMQKPLKNIDIVIRNKGDLDSFMKKWRTGIWNVLPSLVRVRVYNETLYDELHSFFNTKDEDEIQTGASGRILNAGTSKELAMKRSSPRKLPLNSSERLALVKTNEREFAFYEDIRRREKELSKKSRGRPNFPRVKLLLSLESPKPLVQGVRAEEQGSKSYAILMENMGLDLYDTAYGRGYSTVEDFVVETLGQLEGLVYIHDADFVHLDCKPPNFFSKKKVGIADFGLAERTQTGQTLEKNRGTLNNISPEIMLLSLCGQKTDVWGFATTIFFAFTGEPLFDIEIDFAFHDGRFYNHLYLMEKRLGKLPEEVAKMLSQRSFNKFFVRDPKTGKLSLKNEFHYPYPEENSAQETSRATQRNPFTIKPFSDESIRVIFPQYLKSMDYEQIKGVWGKRDDESGEFIRLTGDKYSSYLKTWKTIENNRFVSFEKRIKERALSKCKQKSLEEQRKVMMYADALIDFLKVALEPNPRKRPTSEQLLDTRLMRLAKSVREKRALYQEKSREAQAMRAARTLFSMKV